MSIGYFLQTETEPKPIRNRTEPKTETEKSAIYFEKFSVNIWQKKVKKIYALQDKNMF